MMLILMQKLGREHGWESFLLPPCCSTAGWDFCKTAFITIFRFYKDYFVPKNKRFTVGMLFFLFFIFV